ncbi:MAG: hypothetical protein KKF20_05885 [Bacteroidetes bacterium]|nr:hypothetical protein [Bacteroidota bacterium]
MLGSHDFQFFEELVMDRHTQGIYYKLESLVRTLLIAPAIGASAIALAAVLSKYGNVTENYAYGLGIMWLFGLMTFSMTDPRVYRRYQIVLFSVVLSAILVFNLIIIKPFSLIDMVNELLR